IRDATVTGVQTCALPISELAKRRASRADVQITADFFRQRGIGASAKDLELIELIVGQRFPFTCRLARIGRGGILPAKGSCRRKPGLSGTPGRPGAPALGFGICRTPPNRYPPARLPPLL